MTVSPGQFSDWFRSMNDGRSPYPWQTDLLEALLRTGSWPDAIVAPTGAGKSSVLDVHVFATAVAQTSHGPRPPRRLCHVVGRRALVDDMAQKAHTMGEALRRAVEGRDDSIVGRVGRVLTEMALGNDVQSPLPVTLLRGGIPPSRGWVDAPTACQIICATPDMFGSRLLFRGYGSSRGNRPREAGLLAYDTAVILDEAHLNRQLVTTARRVAELVAESPLARQVAPLQVVATTATPIAQGPALSAVSVDPSSLGDDDASAELSRRLTRPKPIDLRAGLWMPGLSTASKRAGAVDQIATMVTTALQQGDGPVGVVLNRVADALTVFGAIRRQDSSSGQPVRAQLLAGPQRGWERSMADGRNQLDGDIEVYVATQTIEVGVDLDFGTLITDLAPGSSLTQRAGRLNRTGIRSQGQMIVLMPADAHALKEAEALPYTPGDLIAAAGWLEQISLDPAGVSASAVHSSPAPLPAPSRLINSVLDPARVSLLSHTSETYPVEPDLTLWLRDSLEDVREVSVVARNLPYGHRDEGLIYGRPLDRIECLALMEAAPPKPHEVFPSSETAVRRLLSDAFWTTAEADRTVLVQQAGEWLWLDFSSTPSPRFHSGDVICLPADLRANWHGVLRSDGTDELGPLRDVLSDPTTEDSSQRTITVVAAPGDEHTIAVLATRDSNDESPSPIALSLLEVVGDRLLSGEAVDVEHILEALRDRGQDTWFQNLLVSEGPAPQIQVRVGGLSASDPKYASWVCLEVTPQPAEDAELISTRSAGGPVSLDAHQRDVGERAEHFAGQLALEPDIRRSLRLAGEHHDDGKTDPRFQQRLRPAGTEDDGTVWAKSGASLRAGGSALLPRGWRHEQLSAAITLAGLDAPGDLALRLVGTSHGHGRAGFAMASGRLLSEHADERVRQISDSLFDVGHWESLMDRTDAEWGEWAMAYLEALLRGADATISKEGR